MANYIVDMAKLRLDEFKAAYSTILIQVSRTYTSWTFKKINNCGMLKICDFLWIVLSTISTQQIAIFWMHEEQETAKDGTVGLQSGNKI